MSKKDLTPQEQIKIARKKQDKALKKRNRLDRKNPFYPLCGDTDERKELNKKIARAISDENLAKELAKEEAKHPKPAPQTVTVDKSRHLKVETTFGDINSGNKAGVNDNSAFSGNKIATKPKSSNSKPKADKRKPKAKTILFCVVAVLVLAGDAALSSYITSCVYKNKDNSSSTYLVQTI